MANNANIAAEVLGAVGGKENVANLAHCITRLRFGLKDRSAADEAAIKKIDGVLGTTWVGEQFQVIIGQNVTKVYDELLKLGIDGSGEVDAAPETTPDARQSLTPKRVGGAILDYLSKTMVGVIPIMMAGAMFRTVATIIGPTMFGFVAEDDTLYNLLYNWLYNAAFYFLPIYLGYNAAKTLGASPALGMMMGGVLIAPELMNLVNADPAVSTVAIYGIPAPVRNYSQTVLPIMLTIPALWQVEKFLKRVIPDMLSTVFVPFLTMAVMVPVSLCLLAPIGGWLGDGVGAALFSFGDFGGFIASAIIAALWSFLVMTGMHQVLILLAISQMAVTGYDPCVIVASAICQWAVWGMALGAFLRLKSRSAKGANLGFLVSGALGGVSEPALYGCGMAHPRAFSGMVVGGFVGGAIVGLLQCKMYVIGSANLLMITSFLQGGTMNTIGFVVAGMAAFIVATIVTFAFGFSPEELAEDRAIAEAERAA